MGRFLARYFKSLREYCDSKNNLEQDAATSGVNRFSSIQVEKDPLSLAAGESLDGSITIPQFLSDYR